MPQGTSVCFPLLGGGSPAPSTRPGSASDNRLLTWLSEPVLLGSGRCVSALDPLRGLPASPNWGLFLSPSGAFRCRLWRKLAAAGSRKHGPIPGTMSAGRPGWLPFHAETWVPFQAESTDPYSTWQALQGYDHAIN
jgi:hypothetical protein